MMKIVIVLFDVALLYFFFGQSLIRLFYTPARKTKAFLLDLAKHYSHIRRRDLDILPADSVAALDAAVLELRQAALAGNAEADACLEKYRSESSVSLPQRTHPKLCEHLEIVVVALGLAFGVRGLFLQPFKIPTGSMQPTLYGIHFVHTEIPVEVNPIRRVLDYIHYSRRYVDQTVRVSGQIDPRSLRPARPGIPFFPSSTITIGGVTYRLPGSVEDVEKYLRDSLRHTNGHMNKGDVIARGYLELGDHLFVDRTHLAFTEPRRGDVMVFLTDGIHGMNGSSLGGRFYIKRLVGLPGDTLQIRDHQLYVREKGDSDFRLVDENDRPGFARVYSHKGGYRGYSHYSYSRYLNTNDATFDVPENHYFMLGDNSENSRDSRFWGTVPRKNLIGRALCVWWPFSRRWGSVDRVEPLENPTPPTMP